MGELQADVRVQFVGRDFVKQLVIKLGAGAGFLGVGDVLAQVVDGDARAKLIDLGGGANGVGNLFAGDKTGAGALAEAGAFRDSAEGAALRQSNEDCPQHGAPDFCGLGLPEAIILSYGALTVFFTTNGRRLQCADAPGT